MPDPAVLSLIRTNSSQITITWDSDVTIGASAYTIRSSEGGSTYPPGAFTLSGSGARTHTLTLGIGSIPKFPTVELAVAAGTGSGAEPTRALPETVVLEPTVFQPAPEEPLYGPRSFYSWTSFVGQGSGERVVEDSRYDTPYLKFCRGIYGFQFSLNIDEDNPADTKSYFGVTYTPADVDYDGPDLFATSSYPVILDVLERTTSNNFGPWSGDYEVFLNVENGRAAVFLDPSDPDYEARIGACRHIKRIHDDWISLPRPRTMFNYETAWYLNGGNPYNATASQLVDAWILQGELPYICLSVTETDLPTSLSRLTVCVNQWNAFDAELDSRGIVGKPIPLFYADPEKLGFSNGADWVTLLDAMVVACRTTGGCLFGWADGDQGGENWDWETSGIQDRIAEFNTAVDSLYGISVSVPTAQAQKSSRKLMFMTI